MTRRYAHITPAHLTGALALLEKNYHDFITLHKEKGLARLANPLIDLVIPGGVEPPFSP